MTGERSWGISRGREHNTGCAHKIASHTVSKEISWHRKVSAQSPIIYTLFHTHWRENLNEK